MGVFPIGNSDRFPQDQIPKESQLQQSRVTQP